MILVKIVFKMNICAVPLRMLSIALDIIIPRKDCHTLRGVVPSVLWKVILLLYIMKDVRELFRTVVEYVSASSSFLHYQIVWKAY